MKTPKWLRDVGDECEEDLNLLWPSIAGALALAIAAVVVLALR